jgi:hypothetical protein
MLGQKKTPKITKWSQRQAKKVVRNARKKYEKAFKIFQEKPQSFNSYISKNTKYKTSVGPLKNGDTDTKDDSEICEVLNKFFASVM